MLGILRNGAAESRYHFLAGRSAWIGNLPVVRRKTMTFGTTSDEAIRAELGTWRSNIT